jgi:hypothetical protein
MNIFSERLPEASDESVESSVKDVCSFKHNAYSINPEVPERFCSYRLFIGQCFISS